MSTQDDIRQDQAAAEMVAWRTGGDLARDGQSVITYLSVPDRYRWQGADRDALERLGHDSWARWVRQGYEDVRHVSRGGFDRGIGL